TTLPNSIKPLFSSRSQIYQNITYQASSDSTWNVPNTIRLQVADILLSSGNNANYDFTSTSIRMNYEFTRKGPDDNNPIIGNQYLAYGLSANEANILGEVINGTKSGFVSTLP